MSADLAILTELTLPTATYLDQVSAELARQMILDHGGVPLLLLAGRDQLNLVRAHMSTNYPDIQLCEVPAKVLFGARSWWMSGAKVTVVGG